jgi:transcriptional regulator with XRE-family HTH domain
LNKFAEWVRNNDKKQRGVADKLGISTSTLHDILRKGHMPSLKVAYEIEKYTNGAITLYDWVDESQKEKKSITKTITKRIKK